MYDAIMMYKLRFTRGLNIQYSDKWDTAKLREMSLRYESAFDEIEALDIELKELAVTQGYEDLDYKSEL